MLFACQNVNHIFGELRNYRQFQYFEINKLNYFKKTFIWPTKSLNARHHGSPAKHVGVSLDFTMLLFTHYVVFENKNEPESAPINENCQGKLF